MKLIDLLAIWGAVLSTLVAAREIWTARDKLKVEVVFGAREDMPGGGCVIRILNFGKRPIMVQHVGIVWPWRKVSLWEKLKTIAKYPRRNWRIAGWCNGQLPGGGPFEFPELLEPGHSMMCWISFRALDEDSEDERDIFAASAQDALGRNYYSKPFQRR